MQGLLAGYGYEHVGVFHAGSEPRHNLGDWAAYHVPPPPGARGFAVHAEKDREMARRADYGLMIWDGVSPGTFLNVLRLAVIASPCVIYDTMRSRVATTYNVADWRAMLERAGTDVARAGHCPDDAGRTGSAGSVTADVPPPSRRVRRSAPVARPVASPITARDQPAPARDRHAALTLGRCTG